jgi:hypothetical protein
MRSRALSHSPGFDAHVQVFSVSPHERVPPIIPERSVYAERNPQLSALVALNMEWSST